MALGAILGGLGGLAGAISGGAGSRSGETSGINLGAANESELRANDLVFRGLNDLEAFTNAGAGQQDIAAGLNSTRNLASMLQQFSQGGFLPNAQDLATANQFTNDIFAPEQTALNQRFADASMFASRDAARMGRSGNDPILRNKLLQEQTRQQQTLGSQQTAFRAQQAQQLPLQRLQFAQQLAQTNQGLASQALSNRMALLNFGNQIKSQERDFRLQTGSRFTNQQSGGGLGGALLGGLAGLGGAAKAFGGISDLFGSFGGGSAGGNQGGGFGLGMNFNTGLSGQQPQASAGGFGLGANFSGQSNEAMLARPAPMDNGGGGFGGGFALSTDPSRFSLR